MLTFSVIFCSNIRGCLFPKAHSHMKVIHNFPCLFTLRSITSEDEDVF